MEYPESKHSGSYQEFTLVSSGAAERDWKHHLLKLHAPDHKLNPRDWVQPLRLNRKSEAILRQEEAKAAGQEVVEEIADKFTGEEKDLSKVAPGSKLRPEGRRMFERKTQRVFQTEESAASLQLNKEERHPYLLEDSHLPANSREHQRWVGRFEGGQTGSAVTKNRARYVLFVLDADKGAMQVMPVDRSYKFVPRPLSKFKDPEQADLEFNKRIKAKYEDRWANRAKPEASGSRIKAEPGSLRVKQEPAAEPKRFTAVHGEKSKGKGKPKHARDDQSDDEFDFDEEFQDDEEGAGGYLDDNAMMDDEEAKDLANKIKKDLKGGFVGDGYDRDGNYLSDGDDDSETERRMLGKTGKEAKSLLKKHGEYEEDEDDSDASDADLRRERPKDKEKEAKKDAPSAKASRPPSISTSRANSPVPSGIVAKRATSPTGTSRATSPSLKRKAEDSGAESDAGKKARVSKKAPLISDIETVKRILTEETIKSFVRGVPDPNEATAKNLLRYIKKLGVDPRQPGLVDLMQLLIRQTCDWTGTDSKVMVLKNP